MASIMAIIYNRFFLLFIFVIPFSQYLSVRLLVLLLLTFVFILLAKKQTFRGVDQVIRQGWDLFLYLIILWLGLIYSQDILQGLRVIETSFCFLAMPFVFAGFQNEKEKKDNPFLIFYLGVLVVCIILLINSFYRYYVSNDYTVFLFEHLTDIIGIQPTYLAYYTIFAITYGIYVLYYSTIRIHPAFLALSIVFLFLMLVLTGGHTAFISMILILSFFALKYLLDIRTNRKSLSVLVVGIMLFGLLLLSSLDYFKVIFNDYSDYWERAILWQSAIIANPNPFFGVGTGDYIAVLNEYYRSQGLLKFAEGNYNSHNQFIQLYFSNGLLGLLALTIIVGRPLYLALKTNNALGILMIFPFILYGMTEVFLGRYQGVVFFVLLHQLVISNYITSQPYNVGRTTPVNIIRQ